jgi:hypothetical protein
MYDPNNPELREQFHTGFIRGVETDRNYPRTEFDQEDHMYYAIEDAVERGLMGDQEGHELYCSWIARRRDMGDVTVIRIDQRIARPLYE